MLKPLSEGEPARVQYLAGGVFASAFALLMVGA
jgi:hypothetical protein